MRSVRTSWLGTILFFTARKGIRRRRRRTELSVRDASMLPLVKTAMRLSARGTQWIAARQSHHKHVPDFHDKYGNIILLSGTLFCVSIWGYAATQTGIEWNLSPIGKVTPKEWREK